jgi:subtilisin family serine protease
MASGSRAASPDYVTRGGALFDASTATATYTVLSAGGASRAAVAAAVAAAGGRVTASNPKVGMYTVKASVRGFIARVAGSSAVLGAAHTARPVGAAPKLRLTYSNRLMQEVRSVHQSLPTVQRGRRSAGMDPLDHKLWGLRMVRSDLARRVQPGSRRVTVGVMDTGLDSRNPDLAGRFNARLSRNFAPDIPSLDGPCEVPSCVDPVGTDDDGHGTHVAGIIGAAADGAGISGVAPGVTLVELKAGHDAGFFFVDSVVNALTYAADVGIDVVNMSFYVDPWLYNCTDNPADSPESKIEQRTIIAAMNRALQYARRNGVTLVAALGNEHEDLGRPGRDMGSPDYPSGRAYARTIDNGTCLQMPVEGPGVIGVSALGPSGRKADYSSYGTEQISLAAPGGWFRDGHSTSAYRTVGNMILSVLPKAVLQRDGAVDSGGNVTASGAANGVQKHCRADGRCGYYGYLQGTSMAAPHAAGVAALVVSQFGTPDPRRPGTLGMSPALVERVLFGTAARHACPQPRRHSYASEDRDADFDAHCAGNASFNGFYGYGIVDAYAAVTARR